MGQCISALRLIYRWTTLEDPNVNLGSETQDATGNATRDEAVLEAKHKVFLSHSGAQKNFVEQVCVDLESYDRYPFFDKRRHSLVIGQHFPKAIFQAIRQCQVGVLILSEEYFTRTKWPMLELAAMVESKKQNSELVIMPVFFGISRDQCRNVENHKRWESVWLTWKRTDPRINVEKWREALSIFGPTNGLIYNDVLGEVKFREEIVEAICGCIPPETRWDDSHVQGRSRLCQVIREKVKRTHVHKNFGVRVIGLYGVGGLGKTTICKTLCNDYNKEFQDRVAHVEFESDDEVELLRGVLRKLTNTRREVLAGFNKGECTTHLKAKVHQHNVFLAIDNVCDSKEAIEHARLYLRSGFRDGSVVIITSRSLEVLNSVGVAVEDCVKMPKLDAREARSLFLHQVVGLQEGINGEDEANIARCVRLCLFREGDKSDFGYLPLAVKLLGVQSSTLGYDPERWVEELHDTSNKVMGSVFDILRRSFDALEDEDKLLFMDAVLYYPGYVKRHGFKITKFLNILEWLSIVHQTSVKCVKLRLQGLKRKSVLEEVGDRIGVHDLWREFAIMETKIGPLELRRWVYLMDDEKSGFDEVLPCGIRWGAMRRMCFIVSKSYSPKVVNVTMLTKLQYCSNVTVLHLMDLNDSCNVKMLDLTPLNCLKSLVLEGSKFRIGRHGNLWVSIGEVRGLGTLKSLRFLSWTDGYISSACMEDIACLTSLEYLRLSCMECEKLPDLSNLKLLRVVHLDIHANKTYELCGLGSKLIRLQRLILRFKGRNALNKPTTCTCHGISNLMALEELEIEGLVEVEEVFNLQMLTNLQRLTISGCQSIKELRGFDDVVALNSFHLGGSAVSLQELRIDSCRNLRKLLHFGKFTNLRILNISQCCSLQSLPELGELIALEVLEVQNCSQLSEIPDLHKLSNLQKLDLQFCALRTVRGLDGLEALNFFSVEHCGQLVDLPDMCKLRNLRELDIGCCSSLKSLPSLEGLNNLRKLNGDWRMVLEPHKLPARLKELRIDGWGSEGLQNSASLESRLVCRDLDQLNTLPTLPGVFSLKLEGWNFRAVSGLINCTALRKLYIDECHEVEGLPDLPHLQTLLIDDSQTKAVINMGFLPELESLRLYYLTILTELPDLSSCCPKLTKLSVYHCGELRRLTSSAPLIALTSFSVKRCESLRELPDLRLSTKLEYFEVEECGIRLTRPEVSSSLFCRSSWPNVEWEAVP